MVAPKLKKDKPTIIIEKVDTKSRRVKSRFTIFYTPGAKKEGLKNPLEHIKGV